MLDGYDKALSLERKGFFNEALMSLEMIGGVERDPDALNVRGRLLFSLGRIDDARENLALALKLRPAFADALNTLGVIHAQLGEFLEAKSCFENSLAIAGDQVHARCNLAMVLLVLGDWQRGFREFENRWKVSPIEERRRTHLATAWTGDADIRGKTVLLHHEQGLGDSLQFCRYAPLVARRGAHVFLAVPRSLRSLMETLGSDVQVISDDSAIPPHDYCCGLLSLPRVFATTPATVPAAIPYLRASEERVEAWARKLGPRSTRRIGLVWFGRRQPISNCSRDIPFDTVRALLELDAEFVVLQQELTAPEREELAPYPNVTIPGEAFKDFADTAGLIANLDLVVTVDTAVAHLVGALGKPVWLMNRFATCWRWLLGRTDSPWYPTMRIFRQCSLDDWMGVIEDVAAAAESFISLVPKT